MPKNKILFLLVFSFFLFTNSATVFAAPVCTSPNTCETPRNGDCPGGRLVASGDCGSTNICCAPATAATATSSATGGLKYTLLEKIPGFTSTDGSDLPKYITAIYKLALVVIVLSAVLMLSIGGFMYLTSAGNTSAMGTAKGVIFDSIIGLVIALVAWLLLNVINPDLTNVSINGLSAVAVPAGAPGGAPPIVQPSACPSPATATAACCPANKQIQCQACSGSCSEVTGVINKGCGLSKCFLESGLLGRIKNISGVSDWRITESWPPTVNHLSSCHQNGTCADLNNSGGDTSPATIKKYYDAFSAAGLNVLYESNNCPPYIAAGVTNCKSYPTMTSPSSFHVQ